MSITATLRASGIVCFSILQRGVCAQTRSLQWDTWTVSSTRGNCCFLQELIKHFPANLTPLNWTHRCWTSRIRVSPAYFAKRTDFPYMLDEAARTWLHACLVKKLAFFVVQWWPRSPMTLQIDHHQTCGNLPVPLNESSVPPKSHCTVESNSDICRSERIKLIVIKSN